MAVVCSCITHVIKHCVALSAKVFFSPFIFRVFRTLSLCLEPGGLRSTRSYFLVFPVRSHWVSTDDRRPRRPHAFSSRSSSFWSRTVPSHVPVLRPSVSFRSFPPARVIPRRSFLCTSRPFRSRPFACPPVRRKARRFYGTHSTTSPQRARVRVSNTPTTRCRRFRVAAKPSDGATHRPWRAERACGVTITPAV